MDIFSHHGSRGSASTYEPNPFSLLTYLATTIFTVHAFSQTLARKRAADKSIGEPVFGLAEEIEGVLVGLGKKDDSFRGESKGQELVLEMEHRRKSGREVREWYVLTALSCSIPITITRRVKEKIILLDDHPLYGERDMDDTAEIDAEAGGEDITFNMGLTEKQKRDREGVVLPYLDAQKGEGGSGGRILYDMGVEDDFDEEEDEI
ncbi:hypothetical protein MMC09_005536 [Bachmanniomyces sp. S44760]|nr:hypothetical protein [Bachmanniomyces sp. S44760]